MKIGKTEIGANKDCFVIAEACDNHFGSVEKALVMVKMAKLAGANCIKFQHHLPDEEMLKEVPKSDNFDKSLYDFLVENALSLEDHRILLKACNEQGIEYLCTPFSLAAAMELETIGVSAYKIGSGELLDIPTITRIASFGKPLILSTGMAVFEEIDITYNELCKKEVSFALLNCVSEYPPLYSDINLGVITQMKARYEKAIIGHSDHTPTIFTSIGAVALGARIIEKHVTLDKMQPGPDQSVSLSFGELHQLIEGIRYVEAASGNRKKVHEREKAIRSWAHRSLVSTQKIKAGDVITETMIWSKRPGTGIPAREMPEFVGKVAKVNIAENTLLERGWFE